MVPPIVKRYLLAVNRYKWVIPASVVAGLSAGGIVAVQPDPPIDFLGEARLVANAPPITFSTIGSQVRQPVETFTKDTLLTPAVIEGVAKEVGIKPERLEKAATIQIKGGGDPKDPNAAKAEIQLTYKDGDQKRVGEVMALLSKRLIEQSRLNNSARLRAIISAIEQRLPSVRQDLAKAESILMRYDRTEGPQLFAAQDGNIIKSIASSQQQQQQLRLQLDGINAQINSIQRKLGLDPNQAYVSSALSADPIIASLRAQLQQIESQMTVLLKDLRPEHPQVVTLQKQQQAYEEEIRKRAAEVVGGNGQVAPFVANVRQDSNLDPARQQLANTLVNLKTQQESLQQQVASSLRSEQALRQQFSTIPNKQLERTRLEDQVKRQKSLYDQMQQKLVDAKAAEVEIVSSLGVAQAPSVAPASVKAPKSIPITLAVGAIVGLVVGAGVIFLLDMLEGTVYTDEDLREVIRQRDVAILGILPQVKSFIPGQSPILVKPNSPYAEYYERFRSNLRLTETKDLRVIMTISTIENEGKTVTAYNLAIASARAGKRTLLVEADLRSPSAAYQVNLTPDPDSQIEPLRYFGDIGDCIRLAPDVENLYVVTSPGPQSSAASLLESSELRRLLEDARGRFDLVILDSPPLSQCNDALLLEPLTDGMVLVTRPGVTQQSLLEEAIDQLTETANLRLLGAVVNGVEVQLPRAVEDALMNDAKEWLFTSSAPETVVMSDRN
ncbi:polysaccharide biosynthesis tyrosine autokinase [Leptolyngbya sp. FACHB-17]|uniref:GumC family protein n=1 Tax=unclassified Leptolyngbya TaxID=2650499 RepID=UPI0016804980|nr:polysaccharide biosynthesis tyrosine autokinase [Leptolyngbya sp. FACHB-17]MBD2081350.1 polysaccharide biosynthesis tyrosine autokinase [Leptolyngbya sp. FACHB-17]